MAKSLTTEDLHKNLVLNQYQQSTLSIHGLRSLKINILGTKLQKDI